MCGIFGLLGPRALAPPDIAAWGLALAHRGPDDSGTYTEALGAAVCALGHRRLSIIDLSPTGRQPMESIDGRYVLVFNGEIYNFRAVRRELEGLGVRFRSTSDSEVLLAAFARWKRDALAKLRGMFAFAIWDRRDRLLFLARDRLGVKPLYFARYGGRGLVFASEVRTILASGLVERRLSRRGVGSFLAFGSVYEPQTIVDGVHALAPGTWLELSESGEDRGRYYELPVGPTVLESAADVRVRVRSALEEAVRLRLEADVDVGVFLSSGIDSAAVAALASRLASKPIHTVTVTFDEAAWDEGEAARKLAVRFGTNHHEVRLETADMARRMGHAVSALDQPSVDGINTYFVSKAARDAGLKVALSGIGGDELFAGYGAFRRFARAHRLRVLRAGLSLAGPALSFAGRAPGLPVAGRKALSWLAAAGDVGATYASMRMLFSPGQRARLMNVLPEESDLDASLVARLSRSIAAHRTDPLNAYGTLELGHYIRNTLLRDTDSMSMAHGLEVREPLLDHELVELALGIPGAAKYEGEGNKPVLTSAVPEVPRETRVATKRGFTLPFDRWLRTSLRPLAEARLLEASFLDRGEVARLWRGFLAGSREVTWARMWALTVLSDYAARHRLTL